MLVRVGLNRRGMTSVVVVSVLLILLTLLSIGYTRLVNRSLQTITANQQSVAADYAAQSAINDATAYVKSKLLSNPAANVTANNCGDVITGAPGFINPQLDTASKYTCVLIDPQPTSLFYQNLPPYKTQVARIFTSTAMKSILFSWQSTSSQNNKFVPGSLGMKMFDESKWSNSHYAPILRVVLYPMPGDGNLANVQSNSKTFFLYPESATGSHTLDWNSVNTPLQGVNCDNKDLAIRGYSGSADFDCNVAIKNLPDASYYYARISPYYGQANVRIRSNDGSGNQVKFINTQIVIDVTAQSGPATKRLQARTDNGVFGVDYNVEPLNELIPEFPLQSQSTLCKRLLVPPAQSNPVQIDPGSQLYCSL